jgi:hypothetical protein
MVSLGNTLDIHDLHSTSRRVSESSRSPDRANDSHSIRPIMTTRCVYHSFDHDVSGNLNMDVEQLALGQTHTVRGTW